MRVLDSRLGATQRVTYGLLLGICLCVLVTGLMFFLISDNKLNIPFLDVDILPNEQVQPHIEEHEALSRPLFWMGRRPVESLLEVDGEGLQELVVESLDGIKLVGVITKDAMSTALLAVNGKVERVNVGAVVKGWSVSEIHARKVHFSSRDQDTVLILKRELHPSIKLEARSEITSE